MDVLGFIIDSLSFITLFWKQIKVVDVWENKYLDSLVGQFWCLYWDNVFFLTLCDHRWLLPLCWPLPFCAPLGPPPAALPWVHLQHYQIVLIGLHPRLPHLCFILGSMPWFLLFHHYTGLIVLTIGGNNFVIISTCIIGWGTCLVRGDRGCTGRGTYWFITLHVLLDIISCGTLIVLVVRWLFGIVRLSTCRDRYLNTCGGVLRFWRVILYQVILFWGPFPSLSTFEYPPLISRRANIKTTQYRHVNVQKQSSVICSLLVSTWITSFNMHHSYYLLEMAGMFHFLAAWYLEPSASLTTRCVLAFKSLLALRTKYSWHLLKIETSNNLTFHLKAKT